MMIYLIPIPIIFIASIVAVVTSHFGLKLFNKIAKLIITIGVLAFIYFFADYHGYNFFEVVNNLISLKF